MNYQIVADESVDFRIVLQLRKVGLTIYSIAELQPSISDELVLKLANDFNALLITEDKDFGELIFRFQLQHTGILLIRIEEKIQKVLTIANTILLYYEQLLNKFSVIDNSKLRIKE